MIVLTLINLSHVIVVDAQAVICCHFSIDVVLLPSELQHFLVLFHSFFMIFKHSADKAELLIHKKLLLVSLVVLTSDLGFPVVLESFGELAEFHENVSTQTVREVSELELDRTVWVFWKRIQKLLIGQIVKQIEDQLVERFPVFLKHS